MIQIRMPPHRSEHIQHLAVVRRRIPNPIRRKHRQTQRSRDAQRRLIAPLLLAVRVTLHLDIHTLRPKDCNQPRDHLPACLFAPMYQRRRQRPFISPRHADKPASMLFEIANRRRTFAFTHLAHLELRDQLTEVLISTARFT